jgi:CDP-diacylglycerol--serine O-phosphatidyltransferase
MSLKNYVPNFLTCMNLLCGCIGIILVFTGHIAGAGGMIFLAALFDFADGLAARLLHAHSAIGKDLDSLADMVTFGVLPGMILYQLFIQLNPDFTFNSDLPFFVRFIPYASLLPVIYSAIRLAKFNNDSRQSETFIGLPTPANAMMIAAFPTCIQHFLLTVNDGSFNIVEQWVHALFRHDVVFIAFCCLMSYLLIAEIPLFSLKFKTYKWSDQKFPFMLLMLSACLILALKIAAIPVIIILYLFLSLIKQRF